MPLTPEQQSAVVGLARMFLTLDKTGQIYNSKTNKVLRSRDYVNSVLKLCEIPGEFSEPKKPRPLNSLCVIHAQTKEIMLGRVSRDLESSTRNNPSMPVEAWRDRFTGYWYPGTGTGSLSVLIREKKPRKPKKK